MKDGEPYHYPLNYAANAGVWFVYDPGTLESAKDDKVGSGMFSAMRGRRFRDCLDGLSNTMAAAEVQARTPYLRDVGIVGDMAMPEHAQDMCVLGGSFKETTGHTEWVDGRVHQTGFTTTFTPNFVLECEISGVKYNPDFTNMREGKSGSGGQPKTYAAVTSRSYHVGGVNVTMMDGAVRFFSDSIDRQLWQDLSTRDGREFVAVPD